MNPYIFLKNLDNFTEKSVLDVGIGMGDTSYQIEYNNGSPIRFDTAGNSTIWNNFSDIKSIKNWKGIDNDNNFNKIKKFISSIKSSGSNDPLSVIECFNWIQRYLNTKILVMDICDIQNIKENFDFIILSNILHFKTLQSHRIKIIEYLYSILNINGLIYLKSYKKTNSGYNPIIHIEFDDSEIEFLEKFNHGNLSNSEEILYILKK